MQSVWTVGSAGDLALVESLLADADIAFTVTNEQFGALLVGPSIDSYNSRSVTVADDQVGYAREVLSRLASEQESAAPVAGIQRSRTLVEFLLMGGWFFPWRGRLRPRRALIAAMVLGPVFLLALVASLVSVGLLDRWWSGIARGGVALEQHEEALDPGQR